MPPPPMGPPRTIKPGIRTRDLTLSGRERRRTTRRLMQSCLSAWGVRPSRMLQKMGRPYPATGRQHSTTPSRPLPRVPARQTCPAPLAPTVPVTRHRQMPRLPARLWPHPRPRRLQKTCRRTKTIPAASRQRIRTNPVQRTPNLPRRQRRDHATAPCARPQPKLPRHRPQVSRPRFLGRLRTPARQRRPYPRRCPNCATRRCG